MRLYDAGHPAEAQKTKGPQSARLSIQMLLLLERLFICDNSRACSFIPKLRRIFLEPRTTRAHRRPSLRVILRPGELATRMEEAENHTWKAEHDNKQPRRSNRYFHDYNPSGLATPSGNDGGPAPTELGMHIQPEKRFPKSHPFQHASHKRALCDKQHNKSADKVQQTRTQN